MSYEGRCRVHLLGGVDLEHQVFEPHAVVAMGTAVGGTRPSHSSQKLR
jgi:hypothetical protein